MDLGLGNWGFSVSDRECVVDGVWMSYAVTGSGVLGSQ